MRLRFLSLSAGIFLASAAWAQAPTAPQNPGGMPTGRTGAAETPAATRNLAIDDYFRILEIEDARISPEGRWITYVVKTHSLKEDKNQSRIWMVPTSGGSPIPLTAEGVSCNHPRWSPDGKYLAFLSGRDGAKSEKDDEDSKKKEVWLLNREGGEAQKLSDTIQDVSEFSWSPSGDRIVLILQDPSINEIEASKSKEKSDAKPKPHPWVIDRLHFKEDEIGYLDRRRTHLYVFDVASRKMTQITSGDYDDSAPAWSPDGKSIAFSSNRSDPEDPDRNYNTDIWVVAADNADQGKSLVRVTTNLGADGSPAWSPDGKWIAFTSQLEPKLFQYATFHIAIAPASGGEAKVLTLKLDRNSSEPRFSTDGKWIYFIADDDGTQNLMRVPATGGEITRRSADERWCSRFHWEAMALRPQ
jgi:Tol biopolymer transport system component